MNSEAVDGLAVLMKKGIENKVFPGGVLAVLEEGNSTILPFGKHTYEKDSVTVTKETIYDTASITKAIPLAAVVLQLLEEGVLNLNDRVFDILPEFNTDKEKGEVTIEHLISYTVNLKIDQRMSEMIHLPAEEIKNIILTAPLRNEPGKEYFYTNTTAFILGCIVKAVTGNDLSIESKRRFFEPLEMSNSFFKVPEDLKSSCPPTEISEPRGLIQGDVHDEGTFATQDLLSSGVAGLFSNAPDLTKFIQMIMSGGVLNGKRFFKQETIDLMQCFYCPNIDKPLSLFGQKEWQRLSEYGPILGDLPDHVFYKSGFTGTNLIVDLKQNKALITLTNHTYPKRRENFSEFLAFTKELSVTFFK